MKEGLNDKAYFISKRIGKAIWDYRLIKDGDRILLAVSGGKDSLSLLTILLDRMRFVPIRYEVIACVVDMGFEWVNLHLLIDYFEKNSIRYVIAKPPDSWRKDGEEFSCFWCSWSRRKALFKTARELGCTKLALGHHLDDITETLLLNLLFNGEISTMRPYQEMFKGKLAIIRPLAYVEERELADVARSLELPVVKSACPHAETSKRRLVKGIISEVSKHNRNVKKNIFRSLQRIRQEYLLHTPEEGEQ